MADLLFLNVEQGHRRPQRFRFQQNSIIDGYTDDVLLARYRFGGQSILFITNLLEMCRAQHETMNFHADGIYRRGNFLPDIIIIIFFFWFVTLLVSLL